jgi:hypothetical protein
VKASQIQVLCTPKCQHLLECKITYHHNFSVSEREDGIYERAYYAQDIPDVIQVSEHRFAERKVIDLWITLMLVSWYV